MGKPRRPRGGRSNWQPKPPPDTEMPAPIASLPEASGNESSTDVSAAPEATPSPADVETLSAAPEADRIALAEPDAAPAERLAEPEAEIPDSVAHVANPPEADRDDEAYQDSPDDDRAADHAAPDLAPAPVAMRAAAPSALNRIVFAPDRIDIVEIGSTIARYVQGEGEAALAHFRALSDVRTPADLIRLQVGEVQRAADASLSCWVTVMGKASRVVALR